MKLLARGHHAFLADLPLELRHHQPRALLHDGLEAGVVVGQARHLGIDVLELRQDRVEPQRCARHLAAQAQGVQHLGTGLADGDDRARCLGKFQRVAAVVHLQRIVGGVCAQGKTAQPQGQQGGCNVMTGRHGSRSFDVVTVVAVEGKSGARTSVRVCRGAGCRDNSHAPRKRVRHPVPEASGQCAHRASRTGSPERMTGSPWHGARRHGARKAPERRLQEESLTAPDTPPAMNNSLPWQVS